MISVVISSETINTWNLPPPPVTTCSGGELHQLMWLGPARDGWWWVIQCKWEITRKRLHLLSIFGERWPQASFAFPSRCFGSLGGGKVRFGVEESQFAEGRHLSLVYDEGGLQPIKCFQLPKSLGEGLFLAVSPDGMFYSCVAKFWSLTVSSGVIFVVACGPGYHGYIIKE